MNRVKFIKIILILFGVIFLTGCEKTKQEGPVKVHWDRDMCARCVMVVSDRHNTAQVQNPQTGKTYMFDDIGCAILWFEDERIPWRDKAIIWITDVTNGKWINARTAFFDTENITPMAYGFSAHKDKSTIKSDQEIIDFTQVYKRVVKIGK